ncbi:MAG: helix-turn-helix transcriptional regulator [Clostridia bacterium]|nr:helix-turn-helix transcriptional regulator [Clostridia bacterium]
MEYSELLILRIRSICKKKNLSINKLAQMSNLNQSTINNIMQGDSKNPGVQTLHKIANALNMTVAEFLDFQELNDYSFDDNEED